MRALEAAEILAKEGIDVEVIDLRTLKPLDIDTIVTSVKKTGRLVGVTEAYENTSFINEVMAQVNELAFDWLDAPMVRVAAANVPVPRAEVLEDQAIPNVNRIVDGLPKGGELMADEVFIPKLGQTVEEVTLVQWLVEDGAKVKKGQEILEVETDKTTFFVEAEGAGTLHRGPFEPGDGGAGADRGRDHRQAPRRSSSRRHDPAARKTRHEVKAEAERCRGSAKTV